MENCLKRRDHTINRDMEDEAEGFLEGDIQECFLSEERVLSHEYECCLISPYKRLRVEELTHSSVESQAGEGEAHSCLRSSDEADGYHDSYLKASAHGSYDVTSDQVSETEDLGHAKASQNSRESSSQNSRESSSQNSRKASSRGNKHGSMSVSELVTTSHHPEPGKMRSSKLTRTSEGHPRQGLNDHDNTKLSSRVSETELVSSRKDASSLHISSNSERCFTSPQSSYSASISGRPSDAEAPNIDEICMETRCMPPANKRFLTPQSSEYKNASSNYRSCDHLSLASHYFDLQSQSHEQISCCTDVAPLDMRPVKVSQHGSHLFSANEAPADSHTIRCMGPIDLLETNAGNMRTSGGECPDFGTQSWQGSMYDKEVPSYEDEDHYQTIDDLDLETAVSSSKQWEEAITASSVSAVADMKDCRSNRKTHETMNNETNYLKVRPARSIGTSCSNIPSHARQTLTTTIHENTRHDSAYQDYITHTAEGVREDENVASSVFRSMSEAPKHHEPFSTYNQGHSSHQELTASSHCVDSSCTPSVTTSSWDHVQQRYQGLMLERQCSSSSSSRSQGSAKSHASSVQSYHVEELQVHLPGPPQEGHDLYLGGGSRDLVPSSRLSRCGSKGDSRYQSHDGSQNQQHSGTSQSNSVGSVDQLSWSSQASTERSYPSSLAVSGDKSKRAVLQSSGHLKIAAYWNVGLLTIHVIQARCLSSSWKSHCCSYVKMSLVPDESRRTRCKTRIQVNTNNPVFDEKFSLEILEEDQRKRLLVSVWHKDPGNG